jgi:HD superfamily phosphohydrolase
MLNVVNDKLVVEVKGIYSIEKFLIARRLMYWQVYLHKTVLVAESQLVNLLKRARQLSLAGKNIFAPPPLAFFLNHKLSESDFYIGSQAMSHFLMLDDDDIICAIKNWTFCDDEVLARMASDFMARKLCRIEIDENAFDPSRVELLKKTVAEQYGLKSLLDAGHFVYVGAISNNAYSVSDEKINILFNNQLIKDISEASDILNLSVLGKTVTKHYLCYPKWIDKAL